MSNDLQPHRKTGTNLPDTTSALTSGTNLRATRASMDAVAGRADVVDNDLRIQSRRMMQGYVVALVVVTAVIAFSYIALQRTLAEQATLSRSYVVISAMQRAIRDSSVRTADLKNVLSAEEINERLVQKIQQSLEGDTVQIGNLHGEVRALTGKLGERSSNAALEAMFLEPPFALNAKVEQYQTRLRELVAQSVESSEQTKNTWLPVDATAGDKGLLETGYAEVFNAIQVEMTENTARLHTLHSTLSALIILVLVLVTVLIFIPLLAAFKRVQKRVVKAQRELSVQAYFDPATKLPNAAGLAKSLAERPTEGSLVKSLSHSLLVIRIQNFTVISNLIGPGQTDEFFHCFADRLVSIFPAETDIARTGDEEFTVLLDRDYLQQAAENRDPLHKALDAKLTLGNIQIFPVTVLGASLASDKPVQFMDQLLNARLASRRYQSTEATIPLFELSMSDAAEIENDLIEEIRLGIAANEFVPYYQIQIDSQTNAPSGMEALCRWHKADGGVVSPSDFIPVAEKSGLIVELTWSLLDHMVEDYKRWLARGLKPGTIAFNVGSLSLIDPEFIERLTVASNSIDPVEPVFEVEITENIALSEMGDHATDVLARLRSLGYKLALDDFGTGYASLSSLLEINVDVVKIDQSFVKDLAHSSVSRGVVEAVVGMCKTMNKTCVAEGVETQEQGDALREMGCEILQGYYFYKPSDADTVADQLSAAQNLRKAG